MATQRAIIRLTAETLARELHIDCADVRASYSFEDDCVLLRVAHPSLPYVREGEQCQRITLQQARAL